MADKDTSGIGMLRKLAEDVYDDWSLWSILKSGKKAEWGGDDGWPKISDALRSIADQIEREHAEELAAAKRGLTDEARVAVERLRAVSHDEVLKSANPDFDIVNELCAAVGVSRLRTYTGTLDALGERIAELIEHGGKQDADVEWLGADGLPIKAGETVYLDDAHADMVGKIGSEYYGKCGLAGVVDGEALTVSRVGESGTTRVKESVAAWCPASWLTHTPPDTQERIDKDKRKSYVSYWGCLEHECCDCPATVDGKTPDERYGVVSCTVAQGMDIARRQRELADGVLRELDGSEAS